MFDGFDYAGGYVFGYGGLHTHQQITGCGTTLSQATSTQAEGGAGLCAWGYGQAQLMSQDVSHQGLCAQYQIPHSDSMFRGQVWTLT